MRLISYIRVSSNKQVEEGNSLDGQRLDIKRWVQRNKHKVIKEFIDEGHSGYKGKRLVFENMVEYALQNKEIIDGIIVYNFSRFARNQIKRLTTEFELEKAGIKVFSVTEQMPEDEDLAFLLKNIIGTVNEHQSRQNSRTVRDRLKETAKKGFYPGGNIPFGYNAIDAPQQDSGKTRRTLIINPNESEIIHEIFNLSYKGLHGKGMGVKEIANHLNRAAKLKRHSKWAVNDVHRILKNTLYYGDYIFRSSPNTPEEEKIIISFPSIISEELFIKVQKGLSSRRINNECAKGERSHKMLTGILKCKNCGSNMTIMTGKSGRYEYYICRCKKVMGNHKCSCPNLPKDQIEQTILNAICSQLLTKERVLTETEELKESLKSKKRTIELKLLTLFKQKKKFEDKIHILWESVSEEEVLIDSYFKTHIQSLKSRVSSIEEDIHFLKRSTSLPIFKFGEKKVELFLKKFKRTLIENNNSELTKSYLLTVIDKIEVTRGEILIKGGKVKLMEAISKTKSGSLSRVPTFISMWR